MTFEIAIGEIKLRYTQKVQELILGPLARLDDERMKRCELFAGVSQGRVSLAAVTYFLE